MPQIQETVQAFAEGARRARDAGLDGVELHGANGYLITQFLSSAINDRKDEYGGSLENRARFVLDIVRAIRARVGNDFHLQMKISVRDHNDAVAFFGKGPSGNTISDAVQVCRWLVDAGVDAIHVSVGSFFPHPRNPAGVDLPVEDLAKTYDALISGGETAFRTYLLFRNLPELARRQWNEAAPPPDQIEGQNLPDARLVKDAVAVPVICTGGFQTASVIAAALERGRLRCGQHRPAADRQQRPGRDLPPRPGSRRPAVHLLQPLPRQRRQEPARLLRRGALPLARGDARRDHERVRSAGVRLRRASSYPSGECHVGPD